MPTSITRPSFKMVSRENLENTTLTKDVVMPRRHMRHIPDVCEKFQVGDKTKREFYSPNYPDPYPNSTNCVRVLQGKLFSCSKSNRI